MTQVLNQEIHVLSFAFTNGKYTRCIPTRVELNGVELDFIESGLRCLVKRGQEILEIFTMSDGRSQYRLCFEPQNRIWTLLTKQTGR